MNKVILINGFAGVGKLTVAEILSGMTGYTLLDNHMINNIVFPFINIDQDIDDSIWHEIITIRKSVFKIISIGKIYDNFILTNEICDDHIDLKYYSDIEKFARSIKAILCNVVLECDDKEELKKE
ncbi:MAG: hypothetical protein P857_1109 [Candidatus Xenolissoclinum pacificiensis L6]|uniref:Uncharacterized protein n=1 Tax=Candidatus Xenolissoclinum pacificiensis L6 TaxID=1401685 RepID=W2V0Z0_9RICK|nr:MAG: hypothetical protein P857_1109 [Candidatus Xenolissoclinum pacificiensis L6]